MHYGYMIVYKDAAGYEIPLYQQYRGNPLGVSMIFSNELDAEHAKTHTLEDLRERLQFGAKLTVQKTKWLFFKYDNIVHIPIIDENQRRNIRQIINTLHVKRVKVA